MKIVFLGPPGSGKGTYASRIAPKFNIPHISTGDIFREHLKKGTDIGKKIERVMKEGNLVSDDIVMEVVKERISRDDCKNGYIFDGFPRTLEQARMLDEMDNIDVVINIVVPDDWVIKRITSRRTCRKCGKIYNVLFIRPKEEGKCDECGGELYVRDDEKEEVIKERLRVYKELTEPLIEYYRKKGLLKDLVTPSIDAPIPEIVDQIIAMIEVG